MSKLLHELKAAKGIDPVANAFAGTVRSDVYNMALHGRIMFVIYCGVGATGTSTITVNACADVTPSARTAIPFWYRQILTGDTDSAITRAAVTGFTTTAGSSKIITVSADAKDLGGTGYGFIELTMVEVVASPVLGGIMVLADGEPSRYTEKVNATIIV